MSNREPCVVCRNGFTVTWCDTHGIAQCTTCGTPYRILHYDDAGKREDKPPECLFSEDSMEKTRKFHEATGARLSAVALGLSFPGGYDVATKEDIQAGLDHGLLRKETDE